MNRRELMLMGVAAAISRQLPGQSIGGGASAGGKSGLGGGVPAALTPPMTNLQAWYKADSLSASPVSSWADSSANGFTMVQATSGAKPTWSAAQINGLPALSLSGSQFLALSSGAIPFSGQISIYVVWNGSGLATENAFTSSILTNAFEYCMFTNKQLAIKQDTVQIGAGTSTFSNSTWYKSAVTYDSSSGNLAFYINGAAEGTAVNAVSISQGIDNLFSNAAASGFFAGQFAEMLIYSTATYQPAVDSYLLARYGL